MKRRLDKVLFDKITGQLKADSVRVKTGTLVDATIIGSASKGDDEARWVKHKGKAAIHGFKALDTDLFPIRRPLQQRKSSAH